MKRGIIKFMAALAITAVCGGCHNVRETVEEAVAHANVSYELKDSEKEIISATNDFSFKLFQSLADNNKDKDFIISPLGVVYSLTGYKPVQPGRYQFAKTQDDALPCKRLCIQIPCDKDRFYEIVKFATLS